MRTYDEEDIKELNAQPWQIELLKFNPEYVYWGPHEDYMWKERDGWDSRKVLATWKEFGPWQLDDLNECVNFYFSVNRESKRCEVCGGSGYHPDAQWVAESFYGHSTPFRRPTFNERQASLVMASFGGEQWDKKVSGFPSEDVLARYGSEFRKFCESMRDGDGEWHDKITQDEADALLAHHRIRDEEPKDAKSINIAQHGRGFGHDAINRSILVDRRCERFGIPKTCLECSGHGSVFVALGAHVSLTLWWLHPRKGCSRGIEVTKIEAGEVPEVIGFLQSAAERNAQRFAKLSAQPPQSPIKPEEV
jgi:hypothetical protein